MWLQVLLASVLVRRCRVLDRCQLFQSLMGCCGRGCSWLEVSFQFEVIHTIVAMDPVGGVRASGQTVVMGDKLFATVTMLRIVFLDDRFSN